MTADEQLELWCNGESVHNDESDECCPDFSFCYKKTNTPIEIRKKFREAHLSGNLELVNEMLMGFLGEMLKHQTDAKCVIIN